ncbi:MAG: substrate-binding domain-containing protein [Bryobacterales bacterium]|nr:substrate-binding domain-containing protein [Bryobacterales bacterium]
MKRTLAVSRLLYFGALITVGLSLVSCAEKPAAPAGIKTRRYALNVVNSSIPAWLFANDVLKKMSSVTPGLQTEFGGPTGGEVDKQIEQIDALVARHVNGIILCPADPKALAPTVNRALSSGVPIVTIFGDVAGSARLTSITAAERLSAFALVEKVVQDKGWAQGPEKSIQIMAIITKPGLTFAEERLAGVRDAVAKYRTLNLVRVVSNEWSDKKGAEQVAATLQANPRLRAVFGLDSRAAVGAVTALREAGKAKGSLVLTGWDTDEDLLKSVAEGWVHCTSAPNMTYMTQLGISILEAWNLGYLYPESLKVKEFNLPPLPDHIDVAQTLIDTKNVNAFFRQATQ